jgi:hypothetical protein
MPTANGTLCNWTSCLMNHPLVCYSGGMRPKDWAQPINSVICDTCNCKKWLFDAPKRKLAAKLFFHCDVCDERNDGTEFDQCAECAAVCYAMHVDAKSAAEVEAAPSAAASASQPVATDATGAAAAASSSSFALSQSNDDELASVLADSSVTELHVVAGSPIPKPGFFATILNFFGRKSSDGAESTSSDANSKRKKAQAAKSGRKEKRARTECESTATPSAAARSL